MKSILQIIAVILFVSITIEAKDTTVQGLLGGSRSITPEVTNSPNVTSQELLNIPGGRNLVEKETTNAVESIKTNSIISTTGKIVSLYSTQEIAYVSCVKANLPNDWNLPIEATNAAIGVLLELAKADPERIVLTIPNCRYTAQNPPKIDSIPLP